MQQVVLFLVLAAIIFGETFLCSPGSACFAQGKNARSSRAKILVRRDARKAATFELEDQFRNPVSIKFPGARVVVLIFGDRDGSQQIEGWIRPLAKQYQDKIEIHGVAELSAVPGIAKGVVRGIIKNKSKYPIMLDWSGEISKSYGCEKQTANLFVVDKAGNIIIKQRGDATDVELKELFKEINHILKEE